MTEGHPPRKMATVADSTHPTGMHSCILYNIIGNLYIIGDSKRYLSGLKLATQEKKYIFGIFLAGGGDIR